MILSAFLDKSKHTTHEVRARERKENKPLPFKSGKVNHRLMCLNNAFTCLSSYVSTGFYGRLVIKFMSYSSRRSASLRAKRWSLSSSSLQWLTEVLNRPLKGRTLP